MVVVVAIVIISEVVRSSFICKKRYIHSINTELGSRDPVVNKMLASPKVSLQRQRHRQQSGEEMEEEYDFSWEKRYEENMAVY